MVAAAALGVGDVRQVYGRAVLRVEVGQTVGAVIAMGGRADEAVALDGLQLSCYSKPCGVSPNSPYSPLAFSIEKNPLTHSSSVSEITPSESPVKARSNAGFELNASLSKR